MSVTTHKHHMKVCTWNGNLVTGYIVTLVFPPRDNFLLLCNGWYSMTSGIPSLVPRPPLDFISQLRDKIWEWPGDDRGYGIP